MREDHPLQPIRKGRIEDDGDLPGYLKNHPSNSPEGVFVHLDSHLTGQPVRIGGFIFVHQDFNGVLYMVFFHG